MNDGIRVGTSVLLVAIGIILGIGAGILAQSPSEEQASGVVIDFSEYETTWTDADISEFISVFDLLEYACGQNGFELIGGKEGIVSIDGCDGVWVLWTIGSGDTGWILQSPPYDQNPSDYAVISWTCSDDGEREPTVATDYSGHSVYGYARKYRVVSLSPTVTEILYSVKAGNTIVGADYYSDYPESLVSGKKDGSVAIVGTYTNPGLELILATNPDLVVCDGSQTSHVQTAETLRKQGIDAVVIYPGESIEQVLDNIFVVGAAMGYDLAALETIQNTQYVIDKLSSAVAEYGSGIVRTMVTLEPDISPWVSGSDTYVSGLLEEMMAENVFSEWDGWVHITSDRIPYANPQTIIVVTTEYSATQEEYDYLYENLAAQWKLTDAYKNGNVYVICESAATMVERYGPRLAQTAELIAMILHPECFDTEIPKIIGDDYTEYLTYSKDMGYDWS